MGKLKRHPVGRQLVETLELPRDLFFGSVILTVTCRLFLSGKNLKIVYYTNDEMKITGFLEQITYEP